MKARLFLLLMIILVITGCNGQANEKILRGAKGKLDGISSYQYTAIVEVFGNKDSQKYEINHYYKNGKYRLESISPVHLKGKIVIIDDQQTTIYHPNIHQRIVLEDIHKDPYEGMFLGDFINWEFQANMEYSEEKEGDREYLVVIKDISQRKDYHHKQSMWIDKDSKLPQYIEIYDKEGQIRVHITIKDLIINGDIRDELFELNE